MKKLPFHIQHNTTPAVMQRILTVSANGDLTSERVQALLSIKESVLTKVLAPFLRQLGILDGWQLSKLGQRLAALVATNPDLLAEAAHVHLYTLHWRDESAYFSFAYAAICNWLWERGERVLDSHTMAELVGVVVAKAAEDYAIGTEGIAFSKNSVHGALHWLMALQPPAIVERAGNMGQRTREGVSKKAESKKGRRKFFQRRGTCPVQTLLWAASALYEHPESRRDYGVRMALNEERRRALCSITLLTEEALEWMLQLTEQLYDYRRPEGFFGVGTEGGFGRWLILTRPVPTGSLPATLRHSLQHPVDGPQR